jgi:hypothetical protein
MQLSEKDFMIISCWCLLAATLLIIIAISQSLFYSIIGTSSHILHASVLAAFLLLAPHCLKKNGTPAVLHWPRLLRTHSVRSLMGRCQLKTTYPVSFCPRPLLLFALINRRLFLNNGGPLFSHPLSSFRAVPLQIDSCRDFARQLSLATA